MPKINIVHVVDDIGNSDYVNRWVAMIEDQEQAIAKVKVLFPKNWKIVSCHLMEWPHWANLLDLKKGQVRYLDRTINNLASRDQAAQ